MIHMPVTIAEYCVLDLSQYVTPPAPAGATRDPAAADRAESLRIEKLSQLARDLSGAGAKGYQIVHRYENVLILMLPITQKLVAVDPPELSRIAPVAGLRNQ